MTELGNTWGLLKSYLEKKKKPKITFLFVNGAKSEVLEQKKKNKIKI